MNKKRSLFNVFNQLSELKIPLWKYSASRCIFRSCQRFSLRHVFIRNSVSYASRIRFIPCYWMKHLINFETARTNILTRIASVYWLQSRQVNWIRHSCSPTAHVFNIPCDSSIYRDGEVISQKLFCNHQLNLRRAILRISVNVAGRFLQ